MKFPIFLSIFFALHSPGVAQNATRLYLANDDHTDMMWTANEEKYDSAFVHMLDYYLDQIDATIGNADDFQTRFNWDGSYWLRAYKKIQIAPAVSTPVKQDQVGAYQQPVKLPGEYFWSATYRSCPEGNVPCRAVREPWRTSHIETNEKMLKPFGGTLNVNFEKNQINTYRLISAGKKTIK